MDLRECKAYGCNKIISKASNHLLCFACRTERIEKGKILHKDGSYSKSFSPGNPKLRSLGKKRSIVLDLTLEENIDLIENQIKSLNEKLTELKEQKKFIS